MNVHCPIFVMLSAARHLALRIGTSHRYPHRTMLEKQVEIRLAQGGGQGSTAIQGYACMVFCF